jgi:hypothetical protein
MEAGAQYHQVTPRTPAGAVPPAAQVDSGWVDFAGVFLFIAGMMSLLWGIVALANKSFYIQGGLVWEHLNTWGWVTIIAGVIQCLTGGLVLARKGAGQWLTVVVVVVAIFVNFLSLGAYPIWSILAIAANALVLWAVTAHGDAFR